MQDYFQVIELIMYIIYLIFLSIHVLYMLKIYHVNIEVSFFMLVIVMDLMMIVVVVFGVFRVSLYVMLFLIVRAGQII